VSRPVKKIIPSKVKCRYIQSAVGLLFAACTVLHAQMAFVARRDMAIGATPHEIVVADLNNDGKKDLIASNGSSNSFSVLLGAGGGVFKPEVRTTTQNFPNGLVVASFNSITDALLDVVVANSVSNTVQFFPGNGAGGFGVPIGFSTGSGSRPVALGVVDFNGDGKNDLVVVLNQSNTVRFYSGNGLGGFTISGTLPVDLGPVDVVLGDWDGDFRTDLAVVSQLDSSQVPPPNGTLTVAYGCPTGFCFPATFLVGQIPTSITSGLINNDSLPDVVVSNSGGIELSVLYGDTDFGFTPASQVVTPGSPQVVSVADFNGDGMQDIAVGLEMDRGQGAVQLSVGDGLGNFNPLALVSIGSPPGGIAAQDVGGTAGVDLVTTNVGAGTISLLLGDGSGGLASTPSQQIAPGAVVTGIDSADLNADGKVDLAIARTDENQVVTWFGSGTGTFPTSGPVLVLPGSQPGDASASAVLIRNFNSGTVLDIAALNSGPETVSVFPGTGPGTFGSRVDYGLGNSCNASSGAGCVNPEGLADGPLNDSDTTHPDLVIPNSVGDTSFPYGSISVLLQSGGGFGSATRFTGGSGPICTGGVALGLACTSNANCLGRCSITDTTPCSDDPDCPTGESCTNPGAGTCAISPAGAAVGTLNSDGNRDLVVSESALDKAAYLPGNGTGAFASSPSFGATGLGPRMPLMKNLDADTDLDLVTLNSGGSTISSLLGDNTGALTPLATVSGGRTPWRGVLADFNLDGWDDLAVTNLTAGCIAALPGDGTGHFGKPILFGTGYVPRDVSVADLNADGKPDLAVVNESDGSVSILLNSSQTPSLSLVQAAPGTQASWSAFFEAYSYDLIRGDRSLITQGASQVNLGPVVCIENDSPNTDNIGNEDNVTPPLGGVFFYLFRNQDPQVKGSYGRSTLGNVRVPTSGDCL
jgi:VCBS repeat protein